MVQDRKIKNVLKLKMVIELVLYLVTDIGREI